jgi:hypothetical protein
VIAKTNDQLDHSRPLDVHKWSDYPEVNTWVDTLWANYLASEYPEATTAGKRPKASTKKQFKVLLLDLYVAWLEDPELLIGVALTKSSYKPNSRYNALHISYVIVGIIHYLHSIDLIGLHTGTEGAKRRTRIWPSEKLLEHFKSSEITPLMVNIHKDQEVIVLNKAEPDEQGRFRRAGKPIEYKDKDYAEIPRMRQEVKRYNELLRTSFIDIGDLEKPVVEQEYWDRHQRRMVTRQVRINHHNKFVRRVFYRGSWKLGGRFHGGFWQQIKEKRNNILINDHRTVELDFSGLHINMAYALEGLQPLQGDPYEVDLIFDTTPAQQREWIKVLTLMLINAKNEKAAIGAFRDAQPEGTEAKHFTNRQIKQLIEAFTGKHQSISKYFCSDSGVMFMSLDGAITAKVVKHFTDLKEPILSVHDSYICREGLKDNLIKVMNEVITDTLGGYAIGIKANKEIEDLASKSVHGVMNLADLRDEYLNRPEDTQRCEEYEQRWEQHKEWLYMVERPIYIDL